MAISSWRCMFTAQIVPITYKMVIVNYHNVSDAYAATTFLFHSPLVQCQLLHRR